MVIQNLILRLEELKQRSNYDYCLGYSSVKQAYFCTLFKDLPEDEVPRPIKEIPKKREVISGYDTQSLFFAIEKCLERIKDE